MYTLSNQLVVFTLPGGELGACQAGSRVSRRKGRRKAKEEKKKRSSFGAGTLQKPASNMTVLKAKFLILRAKFCWEEKGLLRIKTEGLWKSRP